MGKPRRPKLEQHIPDGLPATFTCPGPPDGSAPEVLWELTITDNNSSAGLFWGTGEDLGTDRPVYHYVPPKKGNPFSAHELAVAAAGECANGRGLVILRELTRGACSFAAAFIANSAQVYCVWSTDAVRARPVDVANMRQTALEKLRELRERRRPMK